MVHGSQVASSLREITTRLDRIQADVARLAQQKVPDHFVPINEAVRHLHCGTDWLLAQINSGVLGPGIQVQVGFLHLPIGSEDDPADLPEGWFSGTHQMG